MAYLGDEEESETKFLFDITIDFLFFLDIIFTFFSAYEVSGGQTEIRLSVIMSKYLTGWFAIDLLATFPTEAIRKLLMTDGDAGGLKMSRLARLPRLYKLAKIFRLLKILKVAKFQQLVKDSFKVFNFS